jgi:hypothetical protein
VYCSASQRWPIWPRRSHPAFWYGDVLLLLPPLLLLTRRAQNQFTTNMVVRTITNKYNGFLWYDVPNQRSREYVSSPLSGVIVYLIIVVVHADW